jgi:hypothetical protein
VHTFRPTRAMALSVSNESRKPTRQWLGDSLGRRSF